MGKGLTKARKAAFMKDPGKVISNMDMVVRNGMMGLPFPEIMQMELSKALVNISGQMGASLKENGRII